MLAQQCHCGPQLPTSTQSEAGSDDSWKCNMNSDLFQELDVLPIVTFCINLVLEIERESIIYHGAGSRLSG